MPADLIGHSRDFLKLAQYTFGVDIHAVHISVQIRDIAYYIDDFGGCFCIYFIQPTEHLTNLTGGSREP